MGHDYTIEERRAYGCRTCVDCEGCSHHWIEECGDEPVGELCHTHVCKHCEQKGVWCMRCCEEGCEMCNWEGVLPMQPEMN